MHPLARLSDLPRVITERVATITYGREIDVKTLDASLASQRLDDWLRSGPPALRTVTWAASDCDIKPDDADHPRPLCVKFLFNRGNASGFGIVTVGTLQGGISGPPRLEYVLISKGVGAQMRFETVTTLAKMPSVLAKYL